MAKTGIIQKHLVTTSTQSVIDLKQISAILRRRRFFIFGFSCMVISVTSLAVIITKPVYQSEMQILVSSNWNTGLLTNKIPEDGKNELNNFQIPPVDYITQVKLMQSSKLMQKAVFLLRSDYPNITIEDIKGDNKTGKKAHLEVATTKEVSGKNSGFRQVFTVSFKDRDPVKTQRVLQAIERVYQDYNIEQKQQRLTQGIAFINNRLPQVKQELIASEKKLEYFRKKHNLLDPIAQSKILLESISDLRKQRQATQVRLKDVQSKYKNLLNVLNSHSQNIQIVSDISQSNRDQTLLYEIKKTELALAKERLRYQDDYPTVEKLKQQHQTQLALLQQQIQEKTTDPDSNADDLLAVDPKSVRELTELQTTALGLIAHDNNLADTEQQVRRELDTYPSLITEYNNLLLNIAVQQQTLEKLAQAQQSWEMKIAQSGFDWQILEEPDLGIYIRNRQWLLMISGILLGPILGGIVALIGELLNQAIFCPQDLQKLTNIQLLGSVPQLKQFSLRNAVKRVFRHPQPSLPPLIGESRIKLPSHQTLDMIYQNILISKNCPAGKSLMLTSAIGGEGKTTLALGLGTSAAHMHQRVLIIDANFHSPSLHKILQLSNDWGLSLLLVDEIDLESHNLQDYIQPIHPSIDILTAGPNPEDTVNLLSSTRMQQIINSFTQIYDLVLIDAPAILNTVDARILASLCHGIVIVGRIGQITPDQLVQTTDILSKLNLIGIIANAVLDSPPVGVRSQESS